VKGGTKDEFDEGTVIRFTSGGRYTYAVIKTGIGWVSTARYDGGKVAKTLDFDELLEVLGRSEVTDVAVATEWSEVE